MTAADQGRAAAYRPFLRGGQRPIARSPERAHRAASPLSLFGNDNSPSPSDAGPPVEILCLRHIIADDVLAEAVKRASDIGVGADRVLVEAGHIEEDLYLAQLAPMIGASFETLDAVARADCPLSDTQLLEAAAAGLMPLRTRNGLVWVVAPRGFAARRLTRMLTNRPDLARGFRLTSSARLNAFIRAAAGDALGTKAESTLRVAFPDLSAAPNRKRMPLLQRLALGTTIAIPAFFLPAAAWSAINSVLAVWFLSFIVLRLVASLIPSWPFRRARRIADNELPVYTVVAALYRESRSVGDLMHAIQCLDYPPEKLDIKLVIEEDDNATCDAIAELGHIPNLQVIVAPDIGPRTKPKALNCALPFARGTFIVIYDAEDRPEPGQLRTALQAFRDEGETLACAQARLAIDNGRDGWLAAMFTAEYAGQFDVFLPGFSRLGLPLPLGGTSNHFRLSALTMVGGWDPYNVTEDADLGIRLARFGLRSVMIASTTYEEAPFSFMPWLKQRTRWLKGWMQTWLVHMRTPRALWRQAGLRGFLTLQISVVGSIVTALVHPIFVIELLSGLIRSAQGDHTWIATGPLAALYGVAISSGYIASVIIGALGLTRRGKLRFAWVLVLIPVYWLLLSVAAWRAVFQLMHDPYRWEKTEHGLARRPPMQRPRNIRNNGADRPPLHPAYASD